MKVSVAIILCGFLLSAYFFHTGTAKPRPKPGPKPPGPGPKPRPKQLVKTYDPLSLYRYYKKGWRSTSLSNAKHGRDFLLEEPAAYYTPNTEKLIKNGSMPRSDLMDYLQGITNAQIMSMIDDAKNLEACWKKVQMKSQEGPPVPFYCYFFWNRNRNSNDCQRIYRHRELARGWTTIMMVECLSQIPYSALTPLSKSNVKSSAGVHIEIGRGLSLQLYAAFSSGMAFNIPERDGFKTTQTTCLGKKFDSSAGLGFTVSYLHNMDDLVGEAMTVELGLDVPMSKSGIDLLLHYNVEERRFIGYGFAFGMGIWLSPVDHAVLSCNTIQIDRAESSVKIKIDDIEPTWNCQQEELGVISADKYGRERICCPATNPPSCSSCMCWFARPDCPVIPATEFSIDAKKTLALSSCLGENYIKEAKNEADCYRHWKEDFSLMYGVWRFETKQCWVSNTFSKHTCKWAPTGPRNVYIR